MATRIGISDVLPGDILLHAGTGEISKLIEWVSESDYSHAAMVYSAGVVAEAVSGGVRLGFPLADRIADTDDFSRIDLYRPTNLGMPVSPVDVLALQACATGLVGLKFALNQMFELALICIVKNKVPPTYQGKVFVTWLLNELLPVDPDKLVCSQFVYLVYHQAQTVPPGALDPQMTVPRASPRQFPSIDWLALWKEYEKAREKAWSGPYAIELPPAPLLNSVPLDPNITDEEFNELLEQWAGVLLGSTPYRATRLTPQLAGLPPVKQNPELVVPQDLANSPQFMLIGQLMP